MGIGVRVAVDIYEGCLARGIRGNALIFGKQNPEFTFDELLFALANRGHVGRSGNAISISPEQMAVLETFKSNGRMLALSPPARAKQHLSDEFLFCFMGFARARSVDYSLFEGADIEHDLNELGLASKTGPCDFIYDGGTMEHVFHVPNVLRNIFDVLTVGGVVLHDSPSNNMVDHGFYQFSPTLLWDYYHANGYVDISVKFGVSIGGVGFRTDYAPGVLDSISNGGLDDSTYGTICWARKAATTVGDRIPQQSVYVAYWKADAEQRS